MNIKQRIVLVIGGIVLALVIFITSETAQTSSEILEAANKSKRTIFLINHNCLIKCLLCRYHFITNEL